MLKINGLLSIDTWNNQFMNTWNPYVEPEKEENNEIAE